jgi:nucleotide-binding universal stress UspA family protein
MYVDYLMRCAPELTYINGWEVQAATLVPGVPTNHSKEKVMYKKILVATDGTKLSNMAVEHAIGLADATGAEVIAVKVVPRYPQTYFEGSVALSADEIKKIEKQWQDEAMAVVNAIKAAGQKKDVKVKATTVKSDLIAEALIAAAKRNKVDLIVMASHGRKGLKRLLLGSETQQVLTHSHIPVLVLR